METRKRCELVRLDKVEDGAVYGNTYVVVYIKQDSVGSNPKPWGCNWVNQKSYQRTVGADRKRKSVLPIVFGINSPQYEGEHGGGYKMQGIKEGSEIIKNRHSVELLKNKSWHHSKDLQLGAYRFSDVNKTGDSPHDSIHSLIRQE